MNRQDRIQKVLRLIKKQGKADLYKHVVLALNVGNRNFIADVCKTYGYPLEADGRTKQR